LHALRIDTDLAVRAESALAWTRLVPPQDRHGKDATTAASLLWRCLDEQLNVLARATGWNRLQAQRRLSRWLRHLAWLAPLGHPGVPQLLTRLPLRQALSFVLDHGDAALLPFVLHALSDAQQARWAGWVWRCCMTGVDLQADGLALPNPAVNLDARSALPRSTLITACRCPAPKPWPHTQAVPCACYWARAFRHKPCVRCWTPPPINPKPCAPWPRTH
jgi:hypothetical protein